ncbi:hypothetical protein [Streptomyces hokutonensis]|uniref:hypothetical protein n=1 Tax=Streptomyces hokutonensis TaxID=1306990 RepID=UPI0036A2ADA8
MTLNPIADRSVHGSLGLNIPDLTFHGTIRNSRTIGNSGDGINTPGEKSTISILGQFASRGNPDR